MDDLAWDLVFYGLMAITFIGIIAGSAAARRKKREGADGDTAAPGSGGASRDRDGPA